MVGVELLSQKDVQLFLPICNVFLRHDKFVAKISTLFWTFMLKFWYHMKAHFVLCDMSGMILFLNLNWKKLSGDKQVRFGKVLYCELNL